MTHKSSSVASQSAGALGTSEVREAPRARVLRWVREGIAAGAFAPGQPLPPEREVARVTQVSAGTVNTAFTQLQEQGVLRSDGGRLRYVAAAVATPTNALLRRTFVLIGCPRVDPRHRAAGWADWLDQGVIDGAHRAGMHCLVYCLDNLASEWQQLVDAQPSGICVDELLKGKWSAVRRLAEADSQVPLAVFGNEPGMATYDRVTVDHEAGGYLVTRHLIESGRRRIALIGPTSDKSRYWFDERHVGYKRALSEAGLEASPVISPPGLESDTDMTRAQFDEQVRHLAGHFAGPLLSEGVDGLIALSDRNVPAMAAACRLLHCAPNERVALAGYDNYWSDLSQREYDDTPPLVSLDKCYYECGQQLFELLRARSANELPDEPQKTLVCPQLAFPSV